MAILRRILLFDTEICTLTFNVTSCDLPHCAQLKTPCLRFMRTPHNCDDLSPRPPLPPPLPVRHKPLQNHVVPFLISGFCALGVALLILTACTILLKQRWTRWRNSRRLGSAREVVFVDEDQHHHGPVDHPIWHITTIGLQQSVIDQITCFKYKRCDKLIEGTDCSVCLGEFEEGDDLRLLPKCSHAFHLTCIDTWLRSHKNCPLCRSPVVDDPSTPVNFGVVSRSSLGQVSSGSSSAGGLDDQGGSVSNNQVGQGESSGGREQADDFGHFPIERVRIAEILKRNRENRVLSDLGDNYRIMTDDVQRRMRRSVSLDVEAASIMSNSIMISLSSLSGEGSSKQQKKMHVEKAPKRWHGNSSMSGLMKSSSIGRSLQKAPVSMKRSFSSSGKVFSSFRGSKSQVSTLPL